jgi:hypothetical protein
VTGKVAERRENLRRLVTNLNKLNSELATKDDELAQLVDSSSRVFRAVRLEDTNITDGRRAACPARCARRPRPSARSSASPSCSRRSSA